MLRHISRNKELVKFRRVVDWDADGAVYARGGELAEVSKYLGF
jgi:hypothetical protein